jgi:hypothetical protein
MAAAPSTQSPLRRDLLARLWLALILLLSVATGCFIVWFATAPDDGYSIWPTLAQRAEGSPQKLPEPLPPAPLAAIAAALSSPPQTALSSPPPPAPPLLADQPMPVHPQMASDWIARKHPLQAPGLPRLAAGYFTATGMLMVPLATYADGRVIWVAAHETRLNDYEMWLARSGHVLTGHLSEAWDQIAKSMARDSGHRKNNGNGLEHPVSYVSPEDAIAYCRWLTQEDRSTGVISRKARYRLPMDAEWSLAIGLGEQPEIINPAHITTEPEFPWGADYPPLWSAGNQGLLTDGYAATGPVMQFPPNALGLYDLVGNVSELVLLSPGSYAQRGSSWFTDQRVEMASRYRKACQPDQRVMGVGFRCVLEERSSD